MDPKDLLPISLEVVKGAFIIGNESTPTLLVAEYRRSEGTYGIVPVSPHVLLQHCHYVSYQVLLV